MCLSQFVMSWLHFQIKPACSAPVSSAESSEPAAASQCEKPAAPTAKRSSSSSGKRKRLREDSPVQNPAVSEHILMIIKMDHSL